MCYTLYMIFDTVKSSLQVLKTILTILKNMQANGTKTLHSLKVHSKGISWGRCGKASSFELVVLILTKTTPFQLYTPLKFSREVANSLIHIL